MREIVIISGKGGTGKTSLAASFAVLAKENVIVADCDVDAADMHLLLDPDFKNVEDFYSGELAIIDSTVCTQCGRCAEACRFEAVGLENGYYSIDPLECEGCGYCSRVCPSGAIRNEQRLVGQLYVSGIKTGSVMVHARLDIGADNSGKLVARVKNEAKMIARKKNTDLVLIDGSPGIGCPVISSLSGAHFVVMVTEPTRSGFHDLKRVFELVKNFQIPVGCIINKADTYPALTKNIESFLKRENIVYLSSLPYDETFTEAMIYGQTIVEYNNTELAAKLLEIWNKILKNIK